MSEFKKGDRVTIYGFSSEEYDVEHVHGDWAWVVNGDSESGRLRHFDHMTKVQPKWEVGKTYRANGRSPFSRANTYRVTAVDLDGNALTVARYAEGTEGLVSRRAELRNNFVEVESDE